MNAGPFVQASSLPALAIILGLALVLFVGFCLLIFYCGPASADAEAPTTELPGKGELVAPQSCEQDVVFQYDVDGDGTTETIVDRLEGLNFASGDNYVVVSQLVDRDGNILAEMTSRTGGVVQLQTGAGRSWLLWAIPLWYVFWGVAGAIAYFCLSRSKRLAKRTKIK